MLADDEKQFAEGGDRGSRRLEIGYQGVEPLAQLRVQVAVVGLVERLVEYEHDYALEDARVGDGQCAELRRQLVELLRRELVEQRAHVTVRRFFIA